MDLRQSTVNDYTICGMRAKYRQENPTHHRGSVMRAAGTGYHAGVARGYLAIMNGEVPDLQTCIDAALEDTERELEYATDGFDWRYQAKSAKFEEDVWDKAKLMDLVERTVIMYFEQNRWWPADRYTVLGVELPFRQTFKPRPEHDRTGTMDLVVQDNETGWVHVVDHKLTKRKWYASKAQPFQSVQAAWYVDATKELFSTDAVTFTYDVMTVAGDFSRIGAHRTEAHIEVSLQQAALVSDVIENGGPYTPNPTSFLCHESYCDWWEKCPFGKTLHT